MYFAKEMYFTASVCFPADYFDRFRTKFFGKNKILRQVVRLAMFRMAGSTFSFEKMTAVFTENV